MADMTLLEALQWANHKLKQHRDEDKETGGTLDSPMLDAEVLLSAVLNVQKSWLFAHFDHPLRDHEIEKFQRMVERRVKHEPVAYITGRKEFYRRTFHVNRFVLIPRPATEVLVNEAIKIVGNSESIPLNSPLPREEMGLIFADIGTGSGAIAVTLAAETHIPVVAIDTNREALVVARKNAMEQHVEDLVDFRQGDLLEPLVKIFHALQSTEAGRTPSISHLILAANLPYLTTSQWESAEPEVKDFEPREALEAGTDGLDAYFNYFRQLKRARSVLPERVTSLIEIDPAQSSRAIALVKHDFPETDPRVSQDLDGLDRMVTVHL